jgi:hypothetical protein
MARPLVVVNDKTRKSMIAHVSRNKVTRPKECETDVHNALLKLDRYKMMVNRIVNNASDTKCVRDKMEFIFGAEIVAKLLD